MTKSDDLKLPPRLVKVRIDNLDVKENDFYQALYTQSQAQFNTYVQAGTILNNYAHIFDILIRLRQAVDHPYLVIYNNSIQTSSESFLNNLDSSDENLNLMQIETSVVDFGEVNSIFCEFCHETPIDLCSNDKCEHHYCVDCVMEYINTLNDSEINGKTCIAVCPKCTIPLNVDFNAKQEKTPVIITKRVSSESKPIISNDLPLNSIKIKKGSILSKINLQNFQTSTKLEALMQVLLLPSKFQFYLGIISNAEA